MGFSGNVATMGLGEIIAFLDRNALQGQLLVTAPEVSVEVFVHEGRLLFPPLTGSGQLSNKALHAIRSRADRLRGKPKRKTVKPGQSGVISRSDLTALLDRASAIEKDRRRTKLEADLHALFLLDDARFEFTPLRLSPGRVQRLEREGVVMDANTLLLEVARRADEGELRRPQRERYEQTPSSGTRVAKRPKRRPGTTTRSISGELSGVGLGALLQDLRSNHRTGVFVIQGGGRIERLYFLEGEAFVLRAREGDAFAREFLGDVLAEAVSSITPDADDDDDSRRSQRELSAGFWELLLLETTRFEFTPGDLPREFHTPRPCIEKVALNTYRFLMQAIGLIDEWTQIQQVLGSTRAIYRFVDPDQKFLCVRQIAEFLMLVDGLLSFEEIVRRSGAPRLEAGRVFRSLISEGTLERTNPSRTVPRQPRGKRRRRRA